MQIETQTPEKWKNKMIPTKEPGNNCLHFCKHSFPQILQLTESQRRMP